MAITPEMLARSGLESGEQKALFCQAGLHVGKYPQLRWLHAIPNANSHRQVAEGVRAGVSDIMLPWPMAYDGEQSPSVCGLYIELKTEKRRKEKNGGCSDEQLEFLDYANKVGYKAVVAYGWQEAWEIIIAYLNGE